MTDLFSNMQEQILKGETEEASALLRMALPGLARELKEEWRDTAKYCQKMRKENFDSRTIGTKLKFKKNEANRFPHMKLPRLAQMALDKEFGPNGWVGNEKAMDWAWKKWPEFRLVESK